MITQFFRKILVGKEQKFIFTKSQKKPFKLLNLKSISLYIHIPFCKTLCPYCPYNRIHYQKKLIKPYFESLIKEIDLYAKVLKDIKISSIYIGGGTPTTMIDELNLVINHIKKKLNFNGQIALETSISEINEEMIEKLKKANVNLISLGVQSFQDKFLKMIGRNYNASRIVHTINLLKKTNFDSINIDLIFAYPNQSLKDLRYDLQNAMNMDVDQITTYPLFTFSYSSVGKFLSLRKAKMPNFFIRRKFYRIIHNFFLDKGLQRVSVWGFKKANKEQYSSVTREFYIGLGAGAGSNLSDVFYFNTFSVNEYINTLRKSILPIAVKLRKKLKLTNFYWFYWKLYETRFSYKDFKKRFKKNKKIRILLKIFKLLKFCIIKNDEIILTEKGSFWIHLAQNYYIINYIDKVWTILKRDPWPTNVSF